MFFLFIIFLNIILGFWGNGKARADIMDIFTVLILFEFLKKYN